MIILDTDHLSLLDRDNLAGLLLAERLAEARDVSAAVSIITYEEQMRGWMSYVAKATTSSRQLDAYRKLRRHVETYRNIPLVDFDELAMEQYEMLRRNKVRIGTMDLKIASIAIANDALLLSRNLSDFSKVPGLRVEDWST